MDGVGVAGGRGGAGWRRWPPVRIQRPTGIRNGALLLLLVALAVVLELIAPPGEPGPGLGRRLPGSYQSLPPPAGITQLPPAVAQPPAAGQAAGLTDGKDVARRHPLRQHPRPDLAATTSGLTPDAPPRTAGGRSGTSRPRTGGPPPVTTTPAVAAPAVGVQVPSAGVRVDPPAVLGRELPEVRVQTPAVSAGRRVPAPRVRVAGRELGLR